MAAGSDHFKGPSKDPGHHHGKPPAGFHDHYKPADLHRLTSGTTAKTLKLAEQYRLCLHGDVARRMGYYHPGPHPKYYHGWISPTYHLHCVRWHYWGPSIFVGVYWYPRWTPWVAWAWHYRCLPLYDPRPYWCRPIVYPVCPVWIYWVTPVWEPLPVVSCGTWVEVQAEKVPADTTDLQLLAIRFVDPGHPDEKLGPRYRVWFRNNGNQDIDQPFDVFLFAANDEKLSKDLPQSGVRVGRIAAGEAQCVDIRLPFEVYTMGRDADGQPAPFKVLHVLVDAGQEIKEIKENNNGAHLPPSEILPVDPAAFAVNPEQVEQGGEVTVAGEGFGPQPGRALMVLDGKETDLEILGWSDLGVQLRVPKLPQAAATEAEIIIIRSDRTAANPVKITITP